MRAKEFEATVIVPVRNASGVVVEQLEALKNQSFQGLIQILVVDDHSSDETAEIVESWISRNPEVSIALIRRLHRGGPNASRNDGIRAAQAPVLLFCDGDDIVDHKWVEALVREIDDDVLLSGVVQILARGYTSVIPGRKEVPQYHGINFAYGGNMAMLASLARRLNGFNEAILLGGTEVDFAIRARIAGVNVRLVPQALINYRLPTRPHTLFSREFRRERGHTYIHRKYSDHVSFPTFFQTLLNTFKSLVYSCLMLIIRRPQAAHSVLKLSGRLSGQIFWGIRFLISYPPAKTCDFRTNIT